MIRSASACQFKSFVDFHELHASALLTNVKQYENKRTNILSVSFVNGFLVDMQKRETSLSGREVKCYDCNFEISSCTWKVSRNLLLPALLVLLYLLASPLLYICMTRPSIVMLPIAIAAWSHGHANLLSRLTIDICKPVEPNHDCTSHLLGSYSQKWHTSLLSVALD